jgi:hypothetical protein
VVIGGGMGPAGLSASPIPPDQGWQLWACNPWEVTTTTALTTRRIAWSRTKVNHPFTLTKIDCVVKTAGDVTMWRWGVYNVATGVGVVLSDAPYAGEVAPGWYTFTFVPTNLVAGEYLFARLLKRTATMPVEEHMINAQTGVVNGGIVGGVPTTVIRHGVSASDYDVLPANLNLADFGVSSKEVWWAAR